MNNFRKFTPENNYGVQDNIENYEEDLKENYTKPGHPIAFSGLDNVYNYYKGHLDKTKIQDILSSEDVYSIHKEFHEQKRNPSYSHFKRYQFQMDLVFKTDLAEFNDGINYWLTCIDTFTRYAFVRLLPNKSGQVVLDAFKSILDEAVEKPKMLVLDRGTEFTNEEFKNFCTENGIKIFFPDSSIHGSYIERFNRSIQDLVHKYLTQNETRRYIDVFPDLLNTYNTRRHRMIGTTPTIAETNDDVHLSMRINMSKYYETIKTKKVKFNVGDSVRISKQKGKFSRGYNERAQWEIFKIKQVILNKKIPMYLLQTYDGSETIKGAFYAFELSKVNSEVFRIENVLKQRIRNGKKELFVKWKGFNDTYNSWIDAANVTKEY